MLPDMMQSDLFSNFTSAEDVISLIYSNVSQTTDKPLEFHPCDIDSRNEHFNCTAEEYLRFYRGPQTLPLIIVLPNCEHRSLLIFVIVVNYVIAIAVVLCIPFFSVELCTGYGTTSVDLQTENVTILYVGVFIAGIVGNVIVCVVIIRHSSMHTATNYYLFSLAVSDLIYLMFGLPYDLSLFWYQYPFSLGLAFCKLRALISEASTYVSVLTIVAFSMERFLAICHPLHLYAMSGFKRAVRIIAALWVISFLSAVPFGVYSKIDYIYYPPDGRKILDSAFCAMLSNPPGFPLWEVSSLVFFAIPMAVMIILYGRMGLQIRFRSKHTSVLGVQQGSQHGESKQSQARKAIIRMLAAVVITFFVSWAPFHAQRLMFLYARDWPEFETLNTWLFSVAGLFYYFSCTINPILYNVMSHRYRVAFKETLCGKRRGFHKSNGFSREAQSSVRDSMISSTGGYDSHLVRMRSSRQSRIKDRDGNVNSTWTKTSLLKENIEEETSPTSDGPTTDVVVVIRNTGNGQPKCFTSNHNQHPTTNNIETSNLKDETCI